MSKRDVVKMGKGKKSTYVVRKKDGKFEEFSNIGKSILEDANVKAKKKVKPGHGHEGDLKRRKK